MKKIALVGNPNAGKTTLFNLLTGSTQRVGNWPGVTVEKKSGKLTLGDETVIVDDLPGIYRMAGVGSRGIDEGIAADYLLSNQADLAVNVVDASNLERNLYLTLELREKGVPCVVILNMMDVAEACGRETDVAKLSQKLGCPVVPVVGIKGIGIDELKKTLAKTLQGHNQKELDYTRAPVVEKLLSEFKAKKGFSGFSRGEICALLEGHTIVADRAKADIDYGEMEQMAKRHGLSDMSSFASKRYQTITEISKHVCQSIGHSHMLTERIDDIVLHRFWGMPIFLGVMYLMFFWSVAVGGAFIDFFDIAAGAVFVDAPTILMEKAGFSQWFIFLLADGLGGGLQTVSTFIPPILFLFAFLSILEDSGYMARAAFVVDRLMGILGLPGKAFVPLLVGFGCTVPAIMGTRTLATVRERVMTIMMAPFMSCGARMPVYALFAVAFFPGAGQNVVFGLYIIGIIVAVFTGLVLKKTVLSGRSGSFVAELPVYHMPGMRNLSIWTWQRLSGFITRAGLVIVPVAMVLTILNAVGTDGRLGHPGRNDSLLAGLGKVVSPVFSPMGLTRENWPATVGLFTGVFAKEAVVGTLNVLYLPQEPQEPTTTGESSHKKHKKHAWPVVKKGVTEAVATIPANLLELGQAMLDPLGIRIDDTQAQSDAATNMEVTEGIFGEMYERFEGKAGAFSYLLFVLLYAPCLAALGAVYKETNMHWTLFMLGWTSALAYTFSVIAYQACTFADHPGSSATWIGVMFTLLFASFIALKTWGFKFVKEGVMANPVGNTDCITCGSTKGSCH